MLCALTRKKFLLSAGGAVSAAAAGGAAIGGLGAMASARSAPSHEQDQRILAFLLGLERIELAFYEGARRADALRGELAEFAAAALIHERDHVATIEAALATPPPAATPVRLDVGDAFARSGAFIAKAVALEDAAVAAFNGQITNLSAELVPAACAIVSVDARHAAWIRDIGRLPPAAGATDAPLAAGDVRALLQGQGLLT
jgi:Ferritin-like domain